MMKVAFYNGRAEGAKFVHKAILLVSDPYVHAELIFSDYISYSSELGIGPRFKKITYTHPERWEFIDLDWVTPEQESRIRHRANIKSALRKAGLIGYDTKGAVGCSILPVTGSAWNDFCSETIYDVAAPEIAIPSLNVNMHPKRLYEVIKVIKAIEKPDTSMDG